MKKQYKCLVILIILFQLSLTGCGPGIEQGLGFNSLEKFKRNFSDFMAFPSYIPFELDATSISIYRGLYNKKGFDEVTSSAYNSKKKYNRIDIFDSVNMEYSVDINEYDLTEDRFYKLSNVKFIYLPNVILEKYTTDWKLELLDNKEHSIYYSENFEYEISYHEKEYLKGSNRMTLAYYTSFDDKVYGYIIQYYVKKGTSKEKIFRLRDKLKEEALLEVIKSHKSLKYENKD